MRVNEAGETVYSHTQFMCPKGAVFGGGIQESPEYHKVRGGRKQKYGKAHFFADRETIGTVVSEMSKTRNDIVLVYSAASKTATVVNTGKAPQEYAQAIAQYQKQNSPAVLEGMEPIDLAVSAIAAVETPKTLTVSQDKEKANKKAAFNVACAKKRELSNG